MKPQSAMQRAGRSGLGLVVLALLAVSSMGQSDNVRVRLVFEGISQENFEKYNNATLTTVAASAGVPADLVYRVGSSGVNPSMLMGSTTPSPSTTTTTTAPTTPSSSSSGTPSTTTETTTTGPEDNKRFPTSTFSTISSNKPVPAALSTDNAVVLDSAAAATPDSTGARRLLAEQAVAEYEIRSNKSVGEWASAEVIRRKVLSSAANFGQASSAGFGKGFYVTLQKNGVPYQPIMYLDGVQILSGGLVDEAPKSRFGSRTLDDPKIFNPHDLAQVHDSNSSMPVVLREVKLIEAPQPAPAAQLLLPIWAIVVICVIGVVAAAITSVFVWKKCSGADREGSQHSGQQFLPSSTDPAAPESREGSQTV